MWSFMKRLLKEYAIFCGLIALVILTNHVLTFQLEVWSWITYVIVPAMTLCLLRFAPWPFSIITSSIFAAYAKPSYEEDDEDDEDDYLFKFNSVSHDYMYNRNLYEKQNALRERDATIGTDGLDKYMDPNFDGFE